MARLSPSRAAIVGMAAIFVLDLALLSNRGLAEKSASARPRQVVDLYERSDTEARILTALDDPTEVEFTDTPLSEAMQFLAELHKITIILDETGFSEEGLAPDEPITRVLAGLSLGKTLNLILEPLDLTYVVANDVLVVTTRLAASRRSETHVYDIRVLTEAGITAEEAGQVIQATICPSSWDERGLHTSGSRTNRSTVGLPGKAGRPGAFGSPSGLPGGIGGSFKQDSSKQDSSPSNTNDDSSCAPGAIVPLTEALVVTQSPLVHREILALLRQLERLQVEKSP